MADPDTVEADSPAGTIALSPARARFMRRLWSLGEYPRGFFIRLLSGAWGTVIDWALYIAVVVIAAAPDYKVHTPSGIWGIAILVAVVVLSRAFTTMVQGSTLAGYRDHFLRMARIISAIGAERSGRGRPAVLADRNTALDMLLRVASGLASEACTVPASHRIVANLLLPVFTGGKLVALKAVRRDDFYHDRTAREIPLDAPGAGIAFSTGKHQVIPNVNDLNYPLLHGQPYKSIAAFPIVFGDAEDEAVVAGVVTVDSTHPYTFTETGVEKRIYPFVSPIAQLIGVVLANPQQQGGAW